MLFMTVCLVATNRLADLAGRWLDPGLAAEGR